MKRLDSMLSLKLIEVSTLEELRNRIAVLEALTGRLADFCLRVGAEFDSDLYDAAKSAIDPGWRAKEQAEYEALLDLSSPEFRHQRLAG